MKSINTNRIRNRKIVSGALYDFLAYLTTLQNPIVLGASEEVGPALNVLAEWAQKRGLNINDNPDVMEWNKKV